MIADSRLFAIISIFISCLKLLSLITSLVSIIIVIVVFIFKVFSSDFVNQLGICPFLFFSLMYFICCQISSELPELFISYLRVKRFILSEFIKERDSLLLSKLVITILFRLSTFGSSSSFFI